MRTQSSSCVLILGTLKPYFSISDHDFNIYIGSLSRSGGWSGGTDYEMFVTNDVIFYGIDKVALAL